MKCANGSVTKGLLEMNHTELYNKIVELRAGRKRREHVNCDSSNTFWPDF